MADPFIGEIRLFGFPRIPVDWVACDGALLPISQYEVLYSLLGTTFGGDGVNTFGVPDLRGRLPISQGKGRNLTSRVLGQGAGEASHTLSIPEMPRHGHALLSTTNPGTTATPDPTVHLAASNVSSEAFYAPQADISTYATMAPQAIDAAGGSGPHDNMMPSLVCNFCICTNGIFPTPT